jgi:hypothetical protein
MKILVLDTETLGVADPRVYNLGWLVYDTADGKVISARDYLIKELYDNSELMNTAYYANKIPLYEEMLADGKCRRIKWGYALRRLAREMKGVDGIYAFNSRFDVRSIAKTCELLQSKNPTADGISDIWKGLANPNITSTREYQEFCKANGKMTKHKTPRCRENAETLFAYLTGNPNYIEQHTALADCKIELAILLAALGN